MSSSSSSSSSQHSFALLPAVLGALMIGGGLGVLGSTLGPSSWRQEGRHAKARGELANEEFGIAPEGAPVEGRFKPDASGRMAASRTKVPRVPLSEFGPTKNDLLLRAARGEEIERVPVWMMRQAGRYLPEFRELRKSADFFTMCQTPELATEVTLQPLERFPTLDAVIVFSDILVIPQAMGMEVQMVPGKGPSFPKPLREPRDLNTLNFKPDMEATLGYVFDVVNLTRQKVRSRVPVIGFSGAPFTLMGYMIEGGGSKTMSKVKTWLYKYPQESKRLLQGITDIVVEYAVGKIKAGAQLIQIFESSGGELTPDLFEEFALPYIRQIASRIRMELREQGLPDVPLTIFARNVRYQGALETLAETEYDTLSIDWGIRGEEARSRVGNRKTLQGNLDPCTLFADPTTIRAEVSKMLQGFGTHRYIANLGHGMLPDHDPEHAHIFIKSVQELSKPTTTSQK